MRDWPADHPRAAAALGLAVGLPGIAAAGLAVTVLVGFAVRSFLPAGLPLSLSLWVVGSVATCVPLWLLVTRCLRRGGSAGVGLGLGLVVLAAAASWLLGWLETIVDPQNGMAGVGTSIVTYVLGLFSLVALVMAIVARRLTGRAS